PDERGNNPVGTGTADCNVATGGRGVASLPRSFLSAAPHEFGHAFGGLMDEYESGGEGGKAKGPGEKPAAKIGASALGVNICEGSEETEVRAVAPWQHWLKTTD